MFLRDLEPNRGSLRTTSEFKKGYEQTTDYSCFAALETGNGALPKLKGVRKQSLEPLVACLRTGRKVLQIYI